MEHLGYLFAAYGAIFVGIFLYVLFAWRRQSRLEADLRSLETRVQSLNLSAKTEEQRAQPGNESR